MHQHESKQSLKNKYFWSIKFDYKKGDVHTQIAKQNIIEIFVKVALCLVM